MNWLKSRQSLLKIGNTPKYYLFLKLNFAKKQRVAAGNKNADQNQIPGFDPHFYFAKIGIRQLSVADLSNFPEYDRF